MKWRMTNQVQEERMLVSTMERQERLLRHHQAQLKWRKSRETRAEQMEMDWEEDWGDKEYMEHMTLDIMMKDLDID